MFEELKAMKKIVDILSDLDSRERKRALTWVTAKLVEEEDSDRLPPARIASFNDSDSLANGSQRGEFIVGQ